MLKQKTGITLIEILVVVAIIGILTATVIVGLNSVREKAKIARVQSNMVQLKNVSQAYYKDHDSTFVGLENDPSVIALRADNTKLGFDWCDGVQAACTYTLPGRTGAGWEWGEMPTSTTVKGSWYAITRLSSKPGNSTSVNICVDSSGYVGTSYTDQRHDTPPNNVSTGPNYLWYHNMVDSKNFLCRRSPHFNVDRGE